MDPESSYPIPDKQIAQSSSSKVIEDQSGHLDSQQQLQQREVDTNVSHVTETQQEQVELIEDTLPDHELDDDHLPPKSNTSVPPKLALQPTPVTFLQRPSSAGQDLTTAFCFGKATKLALNFAGHPSQKQKACKGSNLNLLKHAPPSHEASDPAQTSTRINAQRLETPRNRINDKPRKSKGLQEKMTIRDDFPEGSHTSTERQEQLPESLSLPVRMASPVRDILTPFPAANVGPASEDFPCDSPMKIPVYPDKIMRAEESHHTIPQQRSTAPRQTVARVPKSVDRPPSSVVGPKKVIKVKRKPKLRDQHTADPTIVQPALDSTPSEEDLLNLLAYRLKKDRQNKATHETSLRAKELEVRELKHDQEDLRRQLVDSAREVNLQKKRVGQYKEAISNKVGNLTKFINGLAKDHNQLRDDAKAIKERQDAVRIDGQDLATSIQTARTLAEEWVKKLSEHPKVPLRDAQHQLDRLQGLVDILSRQMEEKSGLLATEQDRTARLEAQIARAADSQQEVKSLINRNRTAIIQKLDDLHISFELARGDSDPNAEADLQAKVEECLGLLKDIHGSDKVLPEELQKITGPIKALSDDVRTSFQQAKEDRANSNKAVLTLEACIKDDILSLKQDLSAGRTLTEQLASLRESQAGLTEKLRGKESALAEAHERCVVLQNDQQSLLSKISALESEAVASLRQSADLSETVIGLREAESANAGLRGNLEKVQNELIDHQGKLQAQIENVPLLQGAKETLQCRVDELQASMATFDQQKITYEQEATQRCNEIRLELAGAAKSGREELVFEYENNLHRLSQQKKDAEGMVDQLKASQGNHAQTLSRFRAQIADLEIKSGEKERRSEGLQEQLRVASEALHAKDAEIQAIKEDRAANVKKLNQATSDASGLQGRVAGLEKLHIQSEGGLAILRAKGEDDDKFRDRVEELCRKLGIIDAAAPLSMETLELLEQRIIIAKENQPPSATSTVPLSQAVVAGTNPITPMDPLPNASLNYTRRPRRKVTRNNVTDNMTVKAPQVLNNPEPDVLLRETRRTETTIETSSITHRVSSRGTETALPSQRRPTQNDYHSVAVVPESQTLNTIVPLSHIEDGNDHVAFTSPLADLSHLFPRTPVGSQKEIGSLDSAKKELQKNSDAAGSSKDGASSRKNVIVYSNDQVQAPLTSHLQRQPKSTKDMNAIAVPPSHSPAHKTATKREVPREPGTSTAKAFDLFPDFSSPSTDHLDRTNLRARTASSGNIIAETAKREKVYNSTARGPAPKSAFSKREIRERQDGPEKNASGPAGVNLAIGPRSQTSSMLPLAHRGTSANNTKLSGGSGTTRGILKNPISTFSGKRGLESVEAQADDPKSRSKRPKAEIDAATSSVVADSQSPSAFRQSNSIRSLGRQQHTYSPSQTARGTTNRQRKRSQTSGADRYELRFRQEFA